MVLGLAAAAGMASQFSVAATMVSSISNTLTAIKQTVVDAFNEVKAWVQSNWPEPLTKDYWTNDAGTGILDPLLNLDWDAIFALPEIPPILTKEYWSNDSGTGVLDPILNFEIDWDRIFDFLIPDWVTTFTDNFDLEIDWGDIFDTILPEWLTTFTDNFDFEIDWNDIFDALLPEWITTFTDNFDFEIEWGDIFDAIVPEWITSFADNFDLDEIDWDDILPEFPEWNEIVPSVTTFFENIDFGVIIRTFVTTFVNIMNTMVSAFNSFFDNINFDATIPNPFGDDWTIPFNLSHWELNRLEIPALAEGGIVTGPTLALIGEAGPEAVVPLGKGGGMGGTYNMTFNLSGLTDRSDKRQFAEEISRLIQQEMRRTVGSGTTRGRY